MQYIDGGVCAANGFQATGLEVGIKGKKTGKKDMAMLLSEVPCKVAGTFTSNLVKAAPVQWDSKVVKESGIAQAIVINSGIANACTGTLGMEYCGEIAKETAQVTGISKDLVLTASTGVIGKQLPIDKIKEGIGQLYPQLGGTEADATLAAEAIMTTDTVSKQVAVQTEIQGKTVKALKDVVQDTFNMVSVDGDTSTNDTVLLLANGMAGNDEITEENADYDTFVTALQEVATTLSKKIAADGEGATALFEVKVVNAASKEDAVTLSKSVVTSSLTKAAIFGHDANWGRILCALGYSGAMFDPEQVDIYFESAAGKIKIVENGVDTGYSEEEATKILSEKEVTAIADMKMGTACATAWGCDLTYDYVKINADYRS